MLCASDLEVGKFLQHVHSMLGLMTMNLQTDADLDICLLIVSQVWARKFSECIEAESDSLPLALEECSCCPGTRRVKQTKGLGALESVLALGHVQSRYSINISSE